MLVLLDFSNSSISHHTIKVNKLSLGRSWRLVRRTVRFWVRKTSDSLAESEHRTVPPFPDRAGNNEALLRRRFYDMITGRRVEQWGQRSPCRSLRTLKPMRRTTAWRQVGQWVSS